MRFFGVNKCRAIVLGGTLLGLGGTPHRVDAQEAQSQSSGRSEMAQFDAFLDAHADIDAQLRANPSLLKNEEFLETHPQLQSFISRHPQVQTQVMQNPSLLMERERRFDANESRRTANPNPDVTRQQVSTMDQFLDKNQNVDRDLRRNPGLINNSDYLQQHPELQTFLNQHPDVKEEIAENPRYFMQREDRFDAQEQGRRGANPNPDLTRQEVASLDQFLDSHPDVDKTLRANPWLIRIAEYLREHPELQTFLDQHPELKEESAETPKYLMQREQQFDARERGGRGVNPNPDLTRQQVAALDQFLDRHPDVDQTLSKNPWLIRNAEYLREHPELQTFLNQHPELKEESAETPKYLMQREKQFDAREQKPRGRNPNPDLTRQEVAEMDQFLDSHPDVDKTLRANPWLVRNAEYLNEHPELQTFLNQHPELKEESAETPKYLMQREQRYDAREQARGDRDRDFDRDRDVNTRDRDHDREVSRDTDSNDRDVDRRRSANPDGDSREVATVDDFLDRHQDIAKSLQKKPELINNQSYLKRHKDLSEFLSEHPAVREEVRENPSSFMRRENQFEARNEAGSMDRDRITRRGVDNDLSKKELQEMDHFLDKHKNIEKDLQKNPMLANDHDYLKHHKSLESFLSKNPQVGEELRENPSIFMQKQQRLEQHRMNNRPPAAKTRTKIEEREQTHTATPH